MAIAIMEKLEIVQARIDRLWRQACEYDNIPDYELFVVFSDDNPYVTPYNEALKEKNQIASWIGDGYIQA